jgi:hypothetical protein
MRSLLFLSGDEGPVCGTADTHLSDGLVLTNQRIAVHSYQALCMRVHAVGIMYTANYCKGGERVPGALNRDLSANGENHDRKTSILQDCWELT